MMSDFKPDVIILLKLRMCSEKLPKYAKSSVVRLKFYCPTISMLLNPF